MTEAKVGLIGIVGAESKQDFWGTMERVAAIGYQGIEGTPGALLEGDVGENLQRFHDLGLQVLTVSASRERLQTDLSGIVAEAKSLQAPRATVWWGPCETRESVLQDAALYNEAGARLAAEGIKLCYHNHEHEYRTAFNGVCAMDILAEHTDPSSVFFELDIAWITFGGADPVAVLRRMADRTPAIHIKDLFALSERGQFTAVGTGVVKVKESIQVARETGIEWMVIEQDTLRSLSAFETITVSYLNLKEAGLLS
ncbi:MAG: sugar phosphate isomerase/epimerase [Cytophagales bacterium]|nr:sugar phosphate isomerase/epimerase [Armatimonadota bacterium]